MISTTTPTPPAIEWQAPVVNNARDALESVACKIERLAALIDNNNADVNDLMAGSSGSVPKQLYTYWMLYLIAGEQLSEIETLIQAVVEAMYQQPVSPVGKHTRLRRAQDWRAAADALNAANSVADPSDTAFDAAGAAFTAMLSTRVSSPADLREKLMLISATRHGIQDSDLDEVFRDFDALGWTVTQAEG